MPTQAQEIALLKAQIAKLEAEKANRQRVWFKVGEKGGISVYGINSRYPVTLYWNQWQRLLAHSDELKAFAAEHQAELKADKE